MAWPESGLQPGSYSRSRAATDIAMKNWFAHALPDTRVTVADELAIDPAKVRRWVSERSVANAIQSTRRLYQLLHHANRLKIPVKERFEILEILLKPLEAQLPLLEGHFFSLPFPLDAQAALVNQLSTFTQGEMVVGYRHVLRGTVKGSWMERRAAANRMVDCAHRIYHYMGGIFINCEMGYHSLPIGLWSMAHNLYQLGQMRHKLGKQVSHNYPGSSVETWEQAYIQFLLCSLIPAHSLRREKRRDILSSMGVWTRLTKLRPTPNGRLRAGYYIQIPSDSGPFYLDTESVSIAGKDSQLLHLDTDELRSFLDQLLEQAKDGGRATIDQHHTLTRETIEQLIEYWSKPRIRRTEREPGNETYEIAIGITALHHLPHTLSEQWNNELPVIRHKGFASQNGERFSEVEFNVEMVKKAWVDVRPSHWNSHSQLGLAVDWSESGCRLSLPVEGLQPVTEGELVALRRHPNEGWRIATVQWLKGGQGAQLQMGLQLLSHDGFPVQVRIRRAYGTSEAINGILALDDLTGQQLYLPNLPGLLQKELLMVFEGMSLPLRLTQRQVETASTVGYGFEFLE